MHNSPTVTIEFPLLPPHYVTKEIWPVMNKTTVVAKRELLYIWPFGVCAWLCGLIFIDRYATDKAKIAMNKAVEKLKKDNIKLWVFPEGNINISTCFMTTTKS